MIQLKAELLRGEDGRFYKRLSRMDKPAHKKAVEEILSGLLFDRVPFAIPNPARYIPEGLGLEDLAERFTQEVYDKLGTKVVFFDIEENKPLKALITVDSESEIFTTYQYFSQLTDYVSRTENSRLELQRELAANVEKIEQNKEQIKTYEEKIGGLVETIVKKTTLRRKGWEEKVERFDQDKQNMHAELVRYKQANQKLEQDIVAIDYAITALGDVNVMDYLATQLIASTRSAGLDELAHGLEDRLQPQPLHELEAETKARLDKQFNDLICQEVGYYIEKKPERKMPFAMKVAIMVTLAIGAGLTISYFVFGSEAKQKKDKVITVPLLEGMLEGDNTTGLLAKRSTFSPGYEIRVELGKFQYKYNEHSRSTMEIYYRKLLAEDWEQLRMHVNRYDQAAVVKPLLPRDISSAWYELKVKFADSSGNSREDVYDLKVKRRDDKVKIFGKRMSERKENLTFQKDNPHIKIE